MTFDETEAYNKPDSTEVAYYKNVVDNLRKELASLREQLKQEKEINDKMWLPVIRYMQSHPELKLGDSISEFAFEFLKERDQLKKHWPEQLNEGLKLAIKRLENEIQLWLIVYPNPQPGSPASYGIDSLNQAIRNIKELDMVNPS